MSLIATLLTYAILSKKPNNDEDSDNGGGEWAMLIFAILVVVVVSIFVVPIYIDRWENPEESPLSSFELIYGGILLAFCLLTLPFTAFYMTRYNRRRKELGESYKGTRMEKVAFWLTVIFFIGLLVFLLPWWVFAIILGVGFVSMWISELREKWKEKKSNS